MTIVSSKHVSIVAIATVCFPNIIIFEIYMQLAGKVVTNDIVLLNEKFESFSI